MLKTQALELLGGTVTATAEAIGISPAAVSQWPDELSDQIRDRVQAALWRMAQQPKQDIPPAIQAQAATRTVAGGV